MCVDPFSYERAWFAGLLSQWEGWDVRHGTYIPFSFSPLLTCYSYEVTVCFTTHKLDLPLLKSFWIFTSSTYSRDFQVAYTTQLQELYSPKTISHPPKLQHIHLELVSPTHKHTLPETHKTPPPKCHSKIVSAKPLVATVTSPTTRPSHPPRQAKTQTAPWHLPKALHHSQPPRPLSTTSRPPSKSQRHTRVCQRRWRGTLPRRAGTRRASRSCKRRRSWSSGPRATMSNGRRRWIGDRARRINSVRICYGLSSWTRVALGIGRWVFARVSVPVVRERTVLVSYFCLVTTRTIFANVLPDSSVFTLAAMNAHKSTMGPGHLSQEVARWLTFTLTQYLGWSCMIMMLWVHLMWLCTALALGYT